MKFGGSSKIAQAQVKDAAYLKESFIAEYDRLCRAMNLHYEEAG
jgi:hypothetical protein